MPDKPLILDQAIANSLDIIGDPYRSDDEVQDYVANKDPLILFKKILHTRNINEDDLQAIRNQVRQSVIDAVAFAEEGMFPDATELYDYMYSNPINFPANTTN